ncbi:unnamed protein product [Prunus armeniaca]
MHVSAMIRWRSRRGDKRTMLTTALDGVFQQLAKSEEKGEPPSDSVVKIASRFAGQFCQTWFLGRLKKKLKEIRGILKRSRGFSQTLRAVSLSETDRQLWRRPPRDFLFSKGYLDLGVRGNQQNRKGATSFGNSCAQKGEVRE